MLLSVMSVMFQNCILLTIPAVKNVCEYVAKEMERLRKNRIPDMPLSLFDLRTDSLKLVHVNIGNIKARLDDIRADNLLMMADIISFNETHLGTRIR